MNCILVAYSINIIPTKADASAMCPLHVEAANLRLKSTAFMNHLAVFSAGGACYFAG